MSITIHGIKSCDTMKKAFTWLAAHDIPYEFHDYKQAGVSHAQLLRWCRACGWETVLNRAGTTFRKLPETQRQDLSEDKAIKLMLASPSMIKRPVLEQDGRIEIGFKPDRYAVFFGKPA